jgi:hypothetical protein
MTRFVSSRAKARDEDETQIGRSGIQRTFHVLLHIGMSFDTNIFYSSVMR